MGFRRGAGVLATVVAGCMAWLAVPQTATATLDIQKKAKAANYPATTCLYCHNEKLPVKGKTTHNDRGKFLIAQKEKKKAKEIDIAWLKDYTPPK
jgi:cytochrome c553